MKTDDLRETGRMVSARAGKRKADVHSPALRPRGARRPGEGSLPHLRFHGAPPRAPISIDKATLYIDNPCGTKRNYRFPRWSGALAIGNAYDMKLHFFPQELWLCQGKYLRFWLRRFWPSRFRLRPQIRRA